jgi:hypothetical protein
LLSNAFKFLDFKLFSTHRALSSLELREKCVMVVVFIGFNIVPVFQLVDATPTESVSTCELARFIHEVEANWTFSLDVLIEAINTLDIIKKSIVPIRFDVLENVAILTLVLDTAKYGDIVKFKRMV